MHARHAACARDAYVNGLGEGEVHPIHMLPSLLKIRRLQVGGERALRGRQARPARGIETRAVPVVSVRLQVLRLADGEGRLRVFHLGMEASRLKRGQIVREALDIGAEDDVLTRRVFDTNVRLLLRRVVEPMTDRRPVGVGANVSRLAEAGHLWQGPRTGGVSRRRPSGCTRVLSDSG